MKFKILVYILTSVFIVVLVLITYLTLFLDPNLIISQLIPYLEETYKLKIDYVFKGKNLLSLINGIEINDVQVRANTKKNKKLLASTKSLFIQFDLLRVLSSFEVSRIRVVDSQVFLENLIDYVNSKEFKEAILATNTNATAVSIKTLSFERAKVNYNRNRFDFDKVIINTSDFRVEGYLTTTRSRFWFDGRNLFIDSLEGKEVIGDIAVKEVRGFLTNEIVEFKIASVKYSNIVEFSNVVVKGRTDKLIFFGSVGEAVFRFGGFDTKIFDPSFTLDLSKGIEGSFEILSSIKGEFRVGDRETTIEAQVSSLGLRKLPREISNLVVGVFDDIMLSGKIRLIISSNETYVYVKSVSKVRTKLDIPLFRNFDVNLDVENDTIEFRVSSRTTKSDIDIVGSIIQSRLGELELRDLRVKSKRLDREDFFAVSSDVGKKVNFGTLPVLVKDAPITITVDEVNLGNNAFRLNGIQIEGKVSIGDGLSSIFEVKRVKFADINISGSGELSFFTNLVLTLKFIPIQVDITKLYSNFGLSAFGGRVYGRGVLRDFEMVLDNNLLTRGTIYMTNIELIGVNIQNQVTKLLNLNLEHIFVDRCVAVFRLSSNVFIIDATLEGDIISKFSISYNIDKGASKVKFEYLKISRSIVENIPRVLFLGREINGIKYSIDDNYLSFEEFEINI